MEQIKLPDGFRIFETQVAGHTFQNAEPEKLGMIKDERTGCVLKPSGKPECGEREFSFYNALQNTEDPVLLQAKSLVPKFYSKVELLINQRKCTFFKLEDLTHNLSKPCIMDIKIGKRTWDPLATAQKREYEEQKYIKCKQTLGLCLPGFQLYTPNSDKVLRYGREHGRNIDSNEFRASIALFLNAQHTVCIPLVQEILNQLKVIRKWFQIQRFYNFYASSLLIVYDFDLLQKLCLKHDHNCKIINGNAQMGNSGNLIENVTPDLKKWVKVRMIDFAHVFPTEQVSLDTNYIFGLQNLIAVIQDLLKQK
ncbi:inositol polyphosphate multikinase [Teleopsis dalmanni]|uniref:inositol polyphosphate multikinase n=1 Tax=Teleopsis dalmanni TaxID=139649 RepID=UPI0018CD7943|nr:inositol polyphosphate multikinase [Teleopsis dalmanni]